MGEETNPWLPRIDASMRFGAFRLGKEAISDLQAAQR
jgi:hypothetical protein